jgi:hypothetical protein
MSTPKPAAEPARPTSIPCAVCTRPVPVAARGRMPETCAGTRKPDGTVVLSPCYVVHDAIKRLSNGIEQVDFPATREGVDAANGLRGDVVAIANALNSKALDANGRRPKRIKAQPALPFGG